MKKLNKIILPLALVLSLAGCDKGFVEKNKNPDAITSLDPALLFTNAERNVSSGNWETYQTIVQQFVNAYNTGATAGPNFNKDVDGFNTPLWNGTYGTPIKYLQQILFLLKGNTSRPNLVAMTRIWRAFNFMRLVDSYGDVPYSEAGLGYISGINYPKYDKSADIYADLYNEIKGASAALTATGDYVKEDLFFGPTGNAAAQTAEWKKFANSLLLRLGMRYSKLDATKAKSIVAEAFAGGVMTSNSDDVFINLYSSTYANPINGGPRGTNPYFYYVTQNFVDFLKNTHDPRMKYMVGKYSNPNGIQTLSPDTVSANQFGFPVGYSADQTTTIPGYRGTVPSPGTGLNYSQPNYNTVLSSTAPTFYMTYSQTALLLAEATFRGWITGGLTAQQYYEAGVKANMDQYNRFPTVPTPAVPATTVASYLAQPGILFDPATALQQINTQYWLASFVDGPEAYSNWRRSGFPVLTVNVYGGGLPGGDGFYRRLPYPVSESSTNGTNYQAAIASMGGNSPNNRVFWDK